MRPTTFKNYILCTIFLTGLQGYAAQAATITTPTPGPISVIDGEDVTITSTGSITSSGIGVEYSDVDAVSFNNEGSITSDDISVYITSPTYPNFSTLSGGITNTGTITNTSNGAVVIENSSIVNGGITNSGTIHSVNGSAILVQNGYDTAVNGGITNTGTLSSDNDVALLIRNGSFVNGDITNSGTIQGISINNGGSLVGNINNNSIINGNTHGVEVGSSGGFIGDLVNNGTITGQSGHGIRIQGSNTVNGTILNNNIISGSQSGVYVSSLSWSDPLHSIINASGASITGLANEGMLLQYGTISNDVINHGSITGQTHGVTLELTVENQITNTGTIQGTTGNGIYFTNYLSNADFSNSGTITGASNGLLILSGGGTTGDFVNDGTIIGQNGMGLSLDSGGNLHGTFTNNNIIQGSTYGIRSTSATFGTQFTNNGSITGQTNAGILLNSGSFNDGFINNGTITGNTNGLQVNYNSINGDITNTGTITGTTDSGLNFSSYGMTGALINTGTITGNIGIFTEQGNISGGIYNNAGGAIIGTSGRAITFGYGQKLYLNGGTIIGDVFDAQPSRDSSTSIVQVDENFTAQGDFYVGDFIVSSGKTMNTAGYGLDTLLLQNNGRLEIGANSTVTAETVQTGTGNYVFEVNGTRAGKLVVTTAPLDLTGSTISVKVGANPTASSYLIIDSASAITGGPGAVPTAVTGSYLWAFNMVDGTVGGSDDSDIYLQLAQQNNMPTTGNVGSVGSVLGSLVTPNAQLQSVQAAINNAPTAAALNSVLNSTLPIVSYASVTAANNVTVNTSNLINTRLTDLSSYGGGVSRSGIASGDLSRDLHFWVQAFGQRGNQGMRANSVGSFEGYDVNTYGTTVGLDSDTLVKNSTIGASFTYANTDVNGLTNADMDIDSYQLSLYGQHNLQNDMFLRGIAAYAYNDISSTRRNIGGVPGLNAFGDYNADQLSTTLTAGRDYKLNNTIVGSPLVTPTVLVNYLHYMPNSYTETGAGGANLSVDGNSMDMLEFGVNLQSKWDWNLANGALLQPSVQAGYRYDVVGDNIQTTSSFTGGGATFGTQGITPAQSTLNGGFGLTYQQSEQVSFTANYNYEHKSDYNSHAAVLRMKYSF